MNALPSIKTLSLLLICCLLSACASRQESLVAATTLAEAVYPGQLEIFDTHLQKDHYDITLAVKGDPVTRIRFSIDPDPSRCQIGTRCEERLRRAYLAGVQAGAKLKALDTALRSCGITALGLYDSHITPSFRTAIELELDPADQQPGLDRLSACIATFRAALPEDASAEQRSLAFKILLPGSKPSAPSITPLTFERRLTSTRADELSYTIGVQAQETAFRADRLLISQSVLSAQALRDQLTDAARKTLASSPGGGHVPKLSFLHGTRLDSQRLDVIHTYILACSQYTSGQGPCKTDLAVQMQYDLTNAQITQQTVLRDIRDASGRLQLPTLPGRGVG